MPAWLWTRPKFVRFGSLATSLVNGDRVFVCCYSNNGHQLTQMESLKIKQKAPSGCPGPHFRRS
jgi:hypothetical protein